MGNWHSISDEEVLKKIGSSRSGLDDQEVSRRVQKFGLNLLPKEKSLSVLKIFLNQLKSPLIYFLFLAGITTIILSDYTDAAVIFLAVIVNTLVGFFQEYKASRALSKLKEVLKVKAVVVRDGLKREILQDELVMGDLILIKSGDKIPADARIIESKNLKVSEASLTGEFSAQDKNADQIDEKVVISDRTNMIYMGTLVEDGSASAVVVATGSTTEIGKIAKIVSETKDEPTPYQKKILKFGQIVGIIIVTLAVGIFILGLLRGLGFVEIFTISVAIAVAAIPEGLPIAMTVVLALGMQRILKRKGLVRRLGAAEALGSTSIICVDKTGTLTEGKMELTNIVTGSKELLYDSSKSFNSDETHLLALKIAASCSEAYIENPSAEFTERIIRGRPTDRALTTAALEVGISTEEIEKEHPRIDQLGFNPNKKISASLNGILGGKTTLYTMGAPEVILKMCSNLELGDEKNIKIDSAVMENLNQKYQALTSKGLRIIATAYKESDKNMESIKDNEFNDLTFVGFLALRDPLRPEIKAMMQEAVSAGLKPVIVTGDHRLTARAIAQELGLPSDEENILEGSDLNNMSEQELTEIIERISVFARVEPIQKLKIVKAWQAKNMVVAMTGDGINDTPALKSADIGLALGSGSEIAKEVSDIVLLDDNFSTIIAAVEEGRSIIENIRKSIVYLISDCFSEVALISICLLIGFPLPVLAAQILWIKLIEHGLPTIALAFEKKDKDLMERKPNRSDIPLLTPQMKYLIISIAITSVLLLTGLFFVLLEHTDYDIGLIRTIMFATMAIMTLFNVFSCKTFRRNIWEISIFSNGYLVAAWLLGILALIAAIYTPLLQELLQTQVLGIANWAVILIVSLVNVALIEITKLYFIVKRKNAIEA